MKVLAVINHRIFLAILSSLNIDLKVRLIVASSSNRYRRKCEPASDQIMHQENVDKLSLSTYACADIGISCNENVVHYKFPVYTNLLICFMLHQLKIYISDIHSRCFFFFFFGYIHG